MKAVLPIDVPLLTLGAAHYILHLPSGRQERINPLSSLILQMRKCRVLTFMAVQIFHYARSPKSAKEVLLISSLNFLEFKIIKLALLERLSLSLKSCLLSPLLEVLLSPVEIGLEMSKTNRSFVMFKMHRQPEKYEKKIVCGDSIDPPFPGNVLRSIRDRRIPKNVLYMEAFFSYIERFKMIAKAACARPNIRKDRNAPLITDLLLSRFLLTVIARWICRDAMSHPGLETKSLLFLSGAVEGFRNTTIADEHYKKHHADFPETENMEQYVKAALSFVNNPPTGVQCIERDDGSIAIYDPLSNTFAAIKEKTLKTFFKPNIEVHGLESNKTYFENQGSAPRRYGGFQSSTKISNFSEIENLKSYTICIHLDAP